MFRKGMFKKVTIILSMITIAFMGILPIFSSNNFNNTNNDLNEEELLTDLVIFETPRLTDINEITYKYEILRGSNDSEDLVGISWEFLKAQMAPGFEEEIYVKIDSGEIENLAPRKDELVFSDLLYSSRYMLKFNIKYANGEEKITSLTSDTLSILSVKINDFTLWQDLENWNYKLNVNYSVSNFYQENNNISDLSKLVLYKLDSDSGEYEKLREVDLEPGHNKSILIDDLDSGKYKFRIETTIPEDVFGEEKFKKSRTKEVEISELNVVIDIDNFGYTREETSFDMVIKTEDSVVGDLIQYHAINGLRIEITDWTEGKNKPEDRDFNFRLNHGENESFDRGGVKRISFPNLIDVHVGLIIFELETETLDGEIEKQEFGFEVNFIEHAWKTIDYSRQEYISGVPPIDTITLRNNSSVVSDNDFKSLVIRIGKESEIDDNPLIQIKLSKEYFNGPMSLMVPIPSGYEFINVNEEYTLLLFVNPDTSKPFELWGSNLVDKHKFTV